MNECQNLYFLSTIALRLAECLSEDELALLSSDIIALGDLLASIVVRQSVCKNKS